MLLELAIGDAYGAGFEYVPAAFVETHNDLHGYVQHPRHGTCPGCYTDDTQMSLAVAEAIVAGDPWTPEALADRFVGAFHRDPREGYAQGFYGFLQSVSSGTEFLQGIRPFSDKSGAAMRAAPIGVFPTIAEVMAKCQVQAALTHNTRDGINAALAASLMTHFFLYDLGPKAHLGTFLEAHVPGRWSQPWSGKVGSKGRMSVCAAITALMSTDSMCDLLQRCIAYRGDVDTVAAIALAAGACARELKQDLPSNLFADLESGAFGRDYIKALDAQLLARVRGCLRSLF
jgi:ADP-ribosyl-[dinitrogen reductase] hydrolase